MPIQLNEENNGRVLIIHVTGKLTKADYENFVPEVERLIGRFGKLSMLFDMTGFHGWDAGAFWEDAKFAVRHFSDVEKFAIVGDKKWHESMAVFCKPFTRARVRYFDYHEIHEARKWLDEV